MTTNLLSVVEQQQAALKHAIKWLNICDKPRECMPLHDAIAAGKQALEQTQGEVFGWVRTAEHGPGVYDPLFLKGSTKPTGYVSGYLPVYTHPQATEPAQSSNPPAKHSESSLLDSEQAPLSHLKTKTGAPPEQGAITSVNGSEPAPKRCGLCGDCDARAQKACTVPACFARDDYKPAPSTAGERKYIDRSAAVNLANNVIANDLTSEDLTTRGVHILADAVLRMDAALQSTALPEASTAQKRLMRELLEFAEQNPGTYIFPRWDGSRVAKYLRVSPDTPAALPVGELTLEQITRIYDRYGGDMVNCTRAIERELAAARSQPTTEESSVVAGAQPVREPLTDWQIDQIYDTYDEYGPTWIHDFARAIEKQHGITKKGEAKEQTP